MVAICDSASFLSHSLDIDPNGQFPIINVTINNFPKALVNLYAPNTHQKFRNLFFLNFNPTNSTP